MEVGRIWVSTLILGNNSGFKTVMLYPEAFHHLPSLICFISGWHQGLCHAWWDDEEQRKPCRPY